MLFTIVALLESFGVLEAIVDVADKFSSHSLLFSSDELKLLTLFKTGDLQLKSLFRSLLLVVIRALFEDELTTAAAAATADCIIKS